MESLPPIESSEAQKQSDLLKNSMPHKRMSLKLWHWLFIVVGVLTIAAVATVLWYQENTKPLNENASKKTIYR